MGERSGPRGHGDDGSAAVGSHGRDDCLDGEHRAHQVHLDGGPQRLGVGFGEWPHVHRATSVGEHDVESARRLSRQGDRRREIGLDGDVGGDVTHRATLPHHRADGVGRPGQHVGPPPTDRDVGPIGGQSFGTAKPNAGAATSDQSGLACNPRRCHR